MSGVVKPLTRKPLARKGLFHGYWFTLEGRKIRRVTRREIAEAYRLRAKYRELL